MKKIASLFAVAMLASSAFAGPVTYADKGGKMVQPMAAPESCFGPGFELGIYGAGFFPKNSGDDYKNAGGAGVLADYFFCKYVGIEGSYTAVDTAGWTHIFNGDLVLRAPIESLCIAPYVLLGGGGSVDGVKVGTFQAGAGVDFRFRSSPLSVFVDGTYNWHSSENRDLDFTLARLGLKFHM